MKKLFYFVLLFACISTIHAQTKTLIHYWNFDNILPTPSGVPPLYQNPNIPNFKASYSKLDTNNAYLEYHCSAKTAGYTYVDGSADTVTTNLRNVLGNVPSANAIRFRNPTDSSELRWHIPTKGYHNIVVTYALETSSTTSGQLEEDFDYSVDGGATWKTGSMTVNGVASNKLDVTQAQYTDANAYGLVTLTFGSDLTVEDNANLILRVKFTGNTTGTKGNNRWDNLTVEGGGSAPPPTQALIHYWHFNNLTQAYHVPNIPNINADYSALSTTSAYLQYYLIPGTSNSYAGYIDNYPPTSLNWQGVVIDTFNARQGVPPGNALRVRNPVDSAELRWHIPTTGYTGIVIKYGLETSSLGNGDSVQVFSYSPDGGTTWKNNGISVTITQGTLQDSLEVYKYPQFVGDSGWGLVTINLTDPSVNNNPNLIFRIFAHRFNPPGSSFYTSGNLRYDNVTVEGNGSGGGGNPNPGKITVTSPKYGNIFVPGQTATLNFTKQNITGPDTISFSADSGKTWSTLGILQGTESSYSATMPNIATYQGLLRVSDSTSGTSGTFIIYPVTKTNRLVHYWDFSNLPTTGYHNPGIPNIPADFSATPTPGLIEYVLEAGAPANYAGYLDPVPGDTVNNHLHSPQINGLRVRNPTDMMELRLALPTTGYSGITINYALQSSSFTGPQVEKFAFSTNSGQSWLTTGFKVNGASVDTLDVTQAKYQSTTGFGRVTLDFTGVQAAENNPNFMLQIKFGDTATSGTSGNNRFDNISVDGTSTANGVAENASIADYSVYPNPADNHVLIHTPAEGAKRFVICDITGKILADERSSNANMTISTSGLASGIYSVRIIDLENNTEHSVKFIKQ